MCSVDLTWEASWVLATLSVLFNMGLNGKNFSVKDSLVVL